MQNELCTGLVVARVVPRYLCSFWFLVFGFWFLAFGLQFSVVVRQQRKRWRVHCNRTAKILCPQGVHAVKEQDRSGLLSNRFYAIRQVVAQCQPLILGLAATRCLHALRLLNSAGISMLEKSAKPRPANRVISAIEKLSPAT